MKVYLTIAGNLLTAIGIMLAMREPHMTDKSKIYKNSMVRSVIGMASYTCLGAYTGIVNQFIVFTRSLYLKKRKMTVWMLIFFQVLFTVLAFYFMENKFAIVSWVSGLMGTYSYYELQRDNNKMFRLLRILCNSTGVVYSCMISNYIAVCYTSYIIVVNVAQYIKLNKQETIETNGQSLIN